MGLRMRVHDREPIGAALRRFKKLVERSGLKREVRAHEYYEKPCGARPAAKEAPTSPGRSTRRLSHRRRSDRTESRTHPAILPRGQE